MASAANQPIRTDAQVRAMHCTPPRAVEEFSIGDPQIPGFALRVYASGRKVFYVVYRVGRHRERLKLGIYTPQVFGLADARAAAKQALAKIIQGGNPAGARAEERRAEDVGGLYEAFEREVVARFPARTQANWRGTSRRLLREVGDLPLTATDAICDRVMALHKRVGITEGKESLAKRVFQHAARLFRWAVEERRIKPSQYPLAGMRSRFQDKKRTRYYDPDEIRRLFEAMDQAAFLDRCFFRLLWYTGSRRGALAAMRWDEIRPDHTAPGEWLWYRQVSKNGDPLEVPLSAHAMTVIESLRPTAGDSAFIFPSQRADGLTGHRSDSSKPVQRLRGASGVADFTNHDIRRTISTYLTRTLDVPTDVVTAILNHRLPGPKANENYVQALPVKRMRAALEAWARHLDGLTAR